MPVTTDTQRRVGGDAITVRGIVPARREIHRASESRRVSIPRPARRSSWAAYRGAPEEVFEKREGLMADREGHFVEIVRS